MAELDDTENPFESPESDLSTDQDGVSTGVRHYGPASRGQRFVNLLVDYVGFLITAFLFGIVLVLFGIDIEAAGPITERVVSVLMMVTYYVALEGLTGRTLGKFVTGTMVIDANGGGRPSFPQLVGRNFARFVPFEAFSFLDDEASGWHDRWSKTRVVRLRPDRMDRLVDD